MISRDYVGSAGASVRCAVISDPTIGPLVGKYWRVRHITIFDSDINGQTYNLYLVDPSAYSALISAIQAGNPVIPNFAGQTAQGILGGMHKLAPGSGVPGADTWATIAQNDSGGDTGGGGSVPNNTSYQEIIVPAGWTLYAVETNGVISGLARFMVLRIAYDEIPAGCSAFSDGPWWG